MRKRGPLEHPRHLRNVATEPCTKCRSPIGDPCVVLESRWPIIPGKWRYRRTDIETAPHMTR